MRRGIAAMAMLLLTVGSLVAACGSASVPSTPRSAAIVGVIKGLDNPFFSIMRDGLVSTAARYKAQLSVDSAANVNDAAGQASLLQSDEAANAGCYVVSPVNATNLIASLSKLPPNTPVVNLDLSISQPQATALGVRITTVIATNNVAAGEAAAGGMARFVPPGGQVAVIAGPSGDPNSQARVEGFRAGGTGRLHVTAVAAADWDTEKAQRAAAYLLARNPHLSGIFAANDLMALGAAAAVDAEHRRGQVAVIGVDGIAQALQAIRRGELSATVAQFPYTMGQLGVEACLAVARGRSVPSHIDTPLVVVTKRTVTQVQQSSPVPPGGFHDPVEALLGK